MSQVGFILQKISTDEFATVEKKIGVDSEIDVKLNLSIAFGIDSTNKQLACFLNLQFEYDTTPFIILKLRCEFSIEPESWDSFINQEKKTIIFPIGFLQHLSVITVGTARGVLHSKTENTDYNRFYLPTLNVKEIVNKTEVFNLK